jgi:hypothetical protein
MADDPCFKPKDTCAHAPSLFFQCVQDLLSDPEPSGVLLNPHSLDLGPAVVKNHRACPHSPPLRGARHHEAHVRLDEGAQREVMIALRRVELSRVGFAVS